MRQNALFVTRLPVAISTGSTARFNLAAYADNNTHGTRIR
jgi:hypothetical protein